MQKLSSLRQHLLDAPLGIKPAELLTFAEDGSVEYHRPLTAGELAGNQDPGAAAFAAFTNPAGIEAGPSFAMSYAAHIIVTDFSGPPVALLWFVVKWIDQNLPGAKPSEAFRFHVDVIDHRKADVSIRLELREPVKVEIGEDGVQLDPQADADARGYTTGTVSPPVDS